VTGTENPPEALRNTRITPTTLGCLIMLPGRKSLIVGACTAPSNSKAHWKKVGAKPPLGGRLDPPKMIDFRPGSAIKQPKSAGAPHRIKSPHPIPGRIEFQDPDGVAAADAQCRIFKRETYRNFEIEESLFWIQI
jgi:hypothetical protein